MSEDKVITTALVLAGGRGTRFRKVIGDDSQKVLFEVGKTPLIKHTTDMLVPYVDRFVFNLGYLANDVGSWVVNQGILQPISFSAQNNWSMASIINNALPFIEEGVVVLCNADEIRPDLDIEEVLSFHRDLGKLATMVGVFRNNVHRYRLLKLKGDGVTLMSTEYKPNSFRDRSDEIKLVNAGVMVLDIRAFNYLNKDSPETGWDYLISGLCNIGEIAVYVSLGAHYFNVGTEEELDEVNIFLGC